jgi:hypothetical protein
MSKIEILIFRFPLLSADRQVRENDNFIRNPAASYEEFFSIKRVKTYLF